MTNSKYNAHTEPLFEDLKLDGIFYIQYINFFYKFTNNTLSKYFSFFIQVQPRYLWNRDQKSQPAAPYPHPYAQCWACSEAPYPENFRAT